MLLEGFGLGEAAIDEGVGGHFGFGFSVGTVHNGFACAPVNHEAEEAVFHGADAVEAPRGANRCPRWSGRIWIQADLEVLARRGTRRSAFDTPPDLPREERRCGR
jgi:hypothetical protein